MPMHAGLGRSLDALIGVALRDGLLHDPEHFGLFRFNTDVDEVRDFFGGRSHRPEDGLDLLEVPPSIAANKAPKSSFTGSFGYKLLLPSVTHRRRGRHDRRHLLLAPSHRRQNHTVVVIRVKRVYNVLMLGVGRKKFEP